MQDTIPGFNMGAQVWPGRAEIFAQICQQNGNVDENFHSVSRLLPVTLQMSSLNFCLSYYDPEICYLRLACCPPPLRRNGTSDPWN
jgi:hypothetical protein